MSAPDDAPGRACKYPLAQGAVTHVAELRWRRIHITNPGRYGRAFWKRWIGYHARSRIEAKIRCLKAFGERIMAKDPDRQTAEIHIRVV